jgi:hypothetical protein
MRFTRKELRVLSINCQMVENWLIVKAYNVKTRKLMEKLIGISGDSLELPTGGWDQVDRWTGSKR